MEPIIQRLNGLSEENINALLWESEEKNYKEKPVDIETFIEDERYLGKIYGKGQIFPYWKRLLSKVYPSPFYSPYEEVILSCAIGAGKCVHKDTYISSSAGIKTIEQMFKDVDVGAIILTEDGPYPITAIIDNGEKEVRVLKTDKGKTLKATSEHRFRVLSKDLRVEWKHVRDIVAGDNLIVACQEQIHGSAKLPKDYAYFLGVLTDIERRSSNQKRILEECCGNDDCAEVVPKIIMQASAEDIWEYISGLIDTNGYVSPDGNVSIRFGHKSLMEGSGILASSLGLNYTLSEKYEKKHNAFNYCLSFVGLDTNKKLAENLHLRFSHKAKRLAIHLDRQHCENAKTKYNHEFMKSSPDLNYLVEHNVTLEQVKEIGKEQTHTYDLSIQDHPSYMINGFVSHNSVVSSVSIAYELYKLLCLKDPNSYYNLLATDTIVFMLFAATQGTATDVNWGYISNILAVSPFFQENLDFKETKAQFIELTEKIGIQIGSRAHKALGKAVLSAVLDEGNFGLIQDQVKNSYNAIMRRRGSRFKQGFNTPGIVWLISSPQTGDDFINERIKKAEGNKKVLIVDNVPIWKVKAEKIGYCGKTFPVFLGDEVQDPCILESEESALNYPADLIIRPPVEYLPDFEADLLDAIRDIAGRRVASSLNLFKSYSQLIKTLRKPNIFRTDTMPVSLNTTLHDFQTYINMPLLKQLIADTSPRFIHLDSSLNGDRYGIASCTSISRDIYDSMTESVISKRIFVNDFSIGLEALNSDGMPASVVAKFLIWLRDQGYPIAMITGDKPATTSIIPELKIAKFKTDYLSLDTDRSPYLVWRSKISAGEYTGTNNKILIKEMYNLRDDGLKVDHPQKFQDGSRGSKDIADACAGAFYACFKNMIPDTMPTQAEFAKRMVEERKRTGQYRGRSFASVYSKLF